MAQGLFSIGARVNLEAAFEEHERHHLADQVFVLDQEDARSIHTRTHAVIFPARLRATDTVAVTERMTGGLFAKLPKLTSIMASERLTPAYVHLGAPLSATFAKTLGV